MIARSSTPCSCSSSGSSATGRAAPGGSTRVLANVGRPFFLRVRTLDMRSASSSPSSGGGPTAAVDARSVVERFYTAYNAGDIDTIESLMAVDCSYHDLIYEEPFTGRSEVVAYMRKVRRTVPPDLKFVIEDATSGDPFKVGVIWHVECGDGITVPFSRGSSFYYVNEAGQITKARDLVESAIKPGGNALALLGLITPLVRSLGPAADPANLKKLPIEAAAWWAFYAAYSWHVLLSTSAPGLPAWQTPPQAILDVLQLSLNFFYVNIGLNAAGVSFIPSVASHPVYEALFNFMMAWSLMVLPVMLSEGRCDKVQNKTPWWAGIMFLTNVFFIPFMATRAAPEPGPLPLPKPLPSWSGLIGASGLAVGLLSLAWAAAARPEFGDWTSRLQYFHTMMDSDRVFYAFVVDAGLYSIWQSILLEREEPRFRFVPFFGLAAYLLTPSPSTSPNTSAQRDQAAALTEGGK